MRTPVRALLAESLVVLAVVGCSAAGPGSRPATSSGSAPPTAGSPSAEPTTKPSTSPTNGPTSSGQDAVAAQLARCEANLESSLVGQVIYPASLDVTKGVGRTYQAAIDITHSTVPPSRRIDAATATTDDVIVQCEVAARLTGVGDVEVSTPDGDTRGDWWFQGFPASGIVEWSWTVTARTTGNYSLLLELQPAAADNGGRYRSISSTARLSYTTQLVSSGNGWDEFFEWWDKYWGALAGVIYAICGLVGAGLLWLITHLTGFDDWAASKLRKGSSTPDNRGQAAATPAAATGNPDLPADTSPDTSTGPPN